MSFEIGAIGTAVPCHTINQTEALELADAVLRPDAGKARLLGPLYRRAGVDNRHICVPYQTALAWATHPPVPTAIGEPVEGGAATQVRMQLYEEHAPPLAFEAARSALKRSDVAPASITHLVTVSCTGFSAPGVDAALIRQLGLPATTQRVHVGFMGCHGAINGLRVPAGLAAPNAACITSSTGRPTSSSATPCSPTARQRWSAALVYRATVMGASSKPGRFFSQRPTTQ